jgi:hypothetical protein
MIRSVTHLAGGKRSAARGHSISAKRTAKASGANANDYVFAALVEFLPERGRV